jgi:acetyl-CoA carboxylase biotin carboxyl carrier protein
MNSHYVLRVPAGVSGVVSFVAPRSGTGYQEPLVVLQSLSVSVDGKASSGSESQNAGAGGLEIRSPIDGIFYCRPSPEDPPFVSAGEEVVLGQTLGLIEVMKTFNPVKFEGVGMPARAKVVRVCVSDQEEVSSGQLVLEVEPLT